VLPDAPHEKDHCEKQVSEVIRILKSLFPTEGSDTNIIKLRTIAKEAYMLADEIYTAQDAEAWGDGFIIPPEVVRSDEALFTASMRNIEKMVTQRKQDLQHIRLSGVRIVNTCRTDNPEISRLMILANKGMPLMVRPEFVPNGKGPLPSLRKSYISVKSAVNRMLYENFDQEGLAFILTKETVLRHIPGLQLASHLVTRL
jgi:hypothetical protein